MVLIEFYCQGISYCNESGMLGKCLLLPESGLSHLIPTTFLLSECESEDLLYYLDSKFKCRVIIISVCQLTVLLDKVFIFPFATVH
jgi:hypothetical protein